MNEQFIQKPDPERGWKLIHALSDSLTEDQRGKFIAKVRDAEGAFTSGLISEWVFLRTISDAVLESL